MNSLLRRSRWVFAFAVITLGAENVVCAHHPGTIPALPFLPPIPWLVIVFGIIWMACGVGLLTRRWLHVSAFAVGTLYIGWTLGHVLPEYIALPGDMGLRTAVFEPLSLACIAILLPGELAVPAWLARACRAVVGIAMIVFGVDHFLALGFIGSLLPDWIPWHVFWVALFGLVFIACGFGIGLRFFERWCWIAIGLMFAIWVVTLHVPRTLGFYGIPGAITDPSEWSSLFIAIGLWGGSWAMAGSLTDDEAH